MINNEEVKNAKTMEEQVIAIARTLELGQSIAYMDEGGFTLHFVAKAKKSNVEKLKNSQVTLAEALYDQESNRILFCLSPGNSYIEGKMEEDRVVGVVPLENERFRSLLILLSENKGDIKFCTVSEDYSVVSARPLLRPQVGRFQLRKALMKAGVL